MHLNKKKTVQANTILQNLYTAPNFYCTLCPSTIFNSCRNIQKFFFKDGDNAKNSTKNTKMKALKQKNITQDFPTKQDIQN